MSQQGLMNVPNTNFYEYSVAVALLHVYKKPDSHVEAWSRLLKLLCESV